VGISRTVKKSLLRGGLLSKKKNGIGWPQRKGKNYPVNEEKDGT